MPKETILGFDLFTWETWDSVDENIYMFSNVMFFPDSLKKFNGSTVGVSRNGDIVVGYNNQAHTIDLFNVPEFVSYVAKRIK